MFQFWLGAFRAFSGPASKVLYSKFLQGNQSALFWGLDESFVNLSAAIGAGFGGYFISIFGFRYMLIISGVITISAGILNLSILRNLKRADLLGIK